nr:IS200/IS605 family transposase [Limosilactobacillus mucosae]
MEKMEVVPDHVHMLISFKPKYSATNIVKALKGAAREYSYVIIQKSSKGNTGGGGHLWSRSYYMGTLGNMSKEVVERYIANQRTLKVTLADHLSKENSALPH